jgi:hypothetical protein
MYRTYNILVLTSVLAMVSGIVALALWLQPLCGDLTRLGGFAENDYGWNAPQRVFDPPRAEPGALDRSYDIVVIGDSYSLRTTPDRQTPYGGFWTDFLAAGTGLRVGVFNVETTPVEAVIEAPLYRAHPPRLLVLEVVERSLWFRLVPQPGACGADIDSVSVGLPRARNAAAPRPLPRATTGWPSVDAAVDRVRKSLLRAIVGDRATEVVRLPLARAGLFTSTAQADLLIYRDEIGKEAWLARDLVTIRCRLQQMRTAIERAGQTRFLFLMPPDKSSAYAAFLSPPISGTNTLDLVTPGLPILAPRLDIALRGAIASGVPDVYLPNDTHWGSAGAEIAARAVMQTLPPPTRQLAETP